jgi:hypothetical protein
MLMLALNPAYIRRAMVLSDASRTMSAKHFERSFRARRGKANPTSGQALAVVVLLDYSEAISGHTPKKSGGQSPTVETPG